jgi:hypothetical protein
MSVVASALVLAAFSVSTNVRAQDKTQDKVQDQKRDQDRLQDPIFGSQLLTDAERIEHRTQMRSLKTAKERTAFQLEHHKRMQERAREKGLTLPDTPPASGKGLGAGTTGGGMGAGPAGGMGAGQSGKK